MEPPATQSSVFILRLPVASQSKTVKTIDYYLSTLLLDLLSLASDPEAHTRDVLINGTSTQTVTLFKETDQSMKDVLQYLQFPYHFPISQTNYVNLLRLAMKYQIVTLVEELIVYMTASKDHASMFLTSCKHGLVPVKQAKAKLLAKDFPAFIMAHTCEQLSAVDSATMRSLIDKFLATCKTAGNDRIRVLNVEHLQAFMLLYSYALQGLLYADLLPVSISSQLKGASVADGI